MARTPRKSRRGAHTSAAAPKLLTLHTRKGLLPEAVAKAELRTFLRADLPRATAERLIRRLAAAGLCCAALALTLPAGGCANPNTTVEVDPARGVIRFFDSKDNDLSIEGFDYARPDGPRIKIESLKLRNNASDVRLANVEQMRIASEMTQAALQALLQAIPMLKPMPAAPSSAGAPPLRERAGEALLKRIEEAPQPRFETEKR